MPTPPPPPTTDITDPAYRAWLTEAYAVAHDEARGGYVCEGRLYDTLDQALAAAHGQEVHKAERLAALKADTEARRLEAEAAAHQAAIAHTRRRRRRLTTALVVLAVGLVGLAAYAWRAEHAKAERMAKARAPFDAALQQWGLKMHPGTRVFDPATLGRPVPALEVSIAPAPPVNLSGDQDGVHCRYPGPHGLVDNGGVVFRAPVDGAAPAAVAAFYRAQLTARGYALAHETPAPADPYEADFADAAGHLIVLTTLTDPKGQVWSYICRPRVGR
jgi:hypothetical protein